MNKKIPKTVRMMPMPPILINWVIKPSTRNVVLDTSKRFGSAGVCFSFVGMLPTVWRLKGDQLIFGSAVIAEINQGMLFCYSGNETEEKKSRIESKFYPAQNYKYFRNGYLMLSKVCSPADAGIGK